MRVVLIPGAMTPRWAGDVLISKILNYRLGSAILFAFGGNNDCDQKMKQYDC